MQKNTTSSSITQRIVGLEGPQELSPAQYAAAKFAFMNFVSIVLGFLLATLAMWR